VGSFKSFRQAANENVNSRVMTGVYFIFACNAGLKWGDKAGNGNCFKSFDRSSFV